MTANKTLARDRFSKQIKRGVVERPEKCSHCGSAGMIIPHHHDYEKPYSVIWLCSKCHGESHRKYDRLENLPDPVDYAELVDKYKTVKKNDIPGSGGQYVIYADEETHTELSIMAARKKVSIKQALKELVEREKKEQSKKD